MNDLVVDIALVFLFVLIGGVFAASEIALVSLRESQVRSLAERSRAGAKVAELTANSNRFLSAVQIGVTLAGFFSASFGAAQIAPQVSPALEALGLGSGVASTIAFVGTTVVISYLSLVFGELVPKRLAMQSAEGFSLVVATPLSWIATIMRPVIWLLGVSTDLVMRVLGRDPREQREEIGAEEIRSMVAEHQSIGDVERQMVVELLAVGDRGVEEIMTPRTEVDFLDADLPIARAREAVADREHSRYPVRGRNDDDVLGFIHVRDLLTTPEGVEVVGDLVREVPFFPTGKRCMAALTEMRTLNSHLAVVVDQDEVGHRDVPEVHPEGVDPEPVVVAGIAGGDVACHALVEPEPGEEPEPGGEALLAVQALLFDGGEGRRLHGARPDPRRRRTRGRPARARRLQRLGHRDRRVRVVLPVRAVGRHAGRRTVQLLQRLVPAVAG